MISSLSSKEKYEDIPTINTAPIDNGPIVRSRAKQISDQVNANLSYSYNLNPDDSAMLSSNLFTVG
jgi:hypothetical protein